MKKFLYFAAAILLAACSHENDSLSNEQEVCFTFSPYEVAPMRSVASISSMVTHLDVWITDGTTTMEVHQTSSDDDFGSLSVTLDKTKTYTMYAVGHKADGATLTDGIIAFTNDKVTHAMYYTTNFSPATTTSINAEMTRIVADFRLEITDEIPVAVKKLRFTISDVYDRWNVSSGGTHQLDRVSLITYNGTSSIFNIYAIVTDTQTTHDVIVEALDENDDVAQTRTFNDVPLRNGYKTTYQGAFFVDKSVSSFFCIESDWSLYDVVNF